MLNITHGSFRRLAGLGLAAAVALGGLTLGTPAVAGEEKTVIEKKVVIVDGEGKHAEHIRHGEGMKCPGELTTVEATGGTEQKKENRKIAICTKSGDKAEIAAGLEKALNRLEGDSDIDPAVRADLSAKLRAKIAEMRGQ